MSGPSSDLFLGASMQYAPCTYLQHLQRAIYEEECAARWGHPSEANSLQEVEELIADYQRRIYALGLLCRDVEPELERTCRLLTDLAERCLTIAARRPWHCLVFANRIFQDALEYDKQAAELILSDPERAAQLSFAAEGLYWLFDATLGDALSVKGASPN